MLSPDTAILLIAHGSRHAPANRELVELAERLGGRGEFAIIESCFLELAEPDIPTAGERCIIRGASRVLMIPYFLSQGVHLTRDLTAARDDLEKRHPCVEFLLGPPLGPDPLLDQLVIERIHKTSEVRHPAATDQQADSRCGNRDSTESQIDATSPS